mgnify:CR=1 FL=1
MEWSTNKQNKEKVSDDVSLGLFICFIIFVPNIFLKLGIYIKMWPTFKKKSFLNNIQFIILKKSKGYSMKTFLENRFADTIYVN